MGLPARYARIAAKVSSAYGAPFYRASVILAPATPGGLNDDGVFVPGDPPTLADCLCQIDQASDYLRTQGSYSDTDYRFIILDGEFRDAINTDASVEVTDERTPADFRVTWSVSSLQRDPAGIGWTGKGRKS